MYASELAILPFVWRIKGWTNSTPLNDGLAQDCSNLSVLATELLQSSTKLLI